LIMIERCTARSRHAGKKVEKKPAGANLGGSRRPFH
jgi:hypothetical protein